MIFCHGCGKQIHETAPTCPHCGAPQKIEKKIPESRSPHWTSITSFVTGIVSFLMMLTESAGTWSQDAIVGGLLLGAIPVVFGIISLSKKQAGRWMAITGLILGPIVILVTMGSM